MAAGWAIYPPTYSGPYLAGEKRAWGTWNKSPERALAWSDLPAGISTEKALACSDHLARISFG